MAEYLIPIGSVGSKISSGVGASVIIAKYFDDNKDVASIKFGDYTVSRNAQGKLVVTCDSTKEQVSIQVALLKSGYTIFGINAALAHETNELTSNDEATGTSTARTLEAQQQEPTQRSYSTTINGKEVIVTYEQEGGANDIVSDGKETNTLRINVKADDGTYIEHDPTASEIMAIRKGANPNAVASSNIVFKKFDDFAKYIEKMANMLGITEEAAFELYGLRGDLATDDPRAWLDSYKEIKKVGKLKDLKLSEGLQAKVEAKGYTTPAEAAQYLTKLSLYARITAGMSEQTAKDNVRDLLGLNAAEVANLPTFKLPDKLTAINKDAITQWQWGYRITGNLASGGNRPASGAAGAGGGSGSAAGGAADVTTPSASATRDELEQAQGDLPGAIPEDKITLFRDNPALSHDLRNVDDLCRNQPGAQQIKEILDEGGIITTAAGIQLAHKIMFEKRLDEAKSETDITDAANELKEVADKDMTPEAKEQALYDMGKKLWGFKRNALASFITTHQDLLGSKKSILVAEKAEEALREENYELAGALYALHPSGAPTNNCKRIIAEQAQAVSAAKDVEAGKAALILLETYMTQFTEAAAGMRGEYWTARFALAKLLASEKKFDAAWQLLGGKAESISCSPASDCEWIGKLTQPALTTATELQPLIQFGRDSSESGNPGYISPLEARYVLLGQQGKSTADSDQVYKALKAVATTSRSNTERALAYEAMANIEITVASFDGGRQPYLNAFSTYQNARIYAKLALKEDSTVATSTNTRIMASMQEVIRERQAADPVLVSAKHDTAAVKAANAAGTTPREEDTFDGLAKIFARRVIDPDATKPDKPDATLVSQVEEILQKKGIDDKAKATQLTTLLKKELAKLKPYNINRTANPNIAAIKADVEKALKDANFTPSGLFVPASGNSYDTNGITVIPTTAK